MTKSEIEKKLAEDLKELQKLKEAINSNHFGPFDLGKYHSLKVEIRSLEIELSEINDKEGRSA